jgi:hypothetical protein
MNEIFVLLNSIFLFIFLYDFDEGSEVLYILGWIPIALIFL